MGLSLPYQYRRQLTFSLKNLTEYSNVCLFQGLYPRKRQTTQIFWIDIKIKESR